MNDSIKKYLKFLPIAVEVSKLSKDQSTQVGAIALDDDYAIRALAYNGFPRGVDDDIELRHERPTKYLFTSHAEENLVAQSARIGVSLHGCTVIVTSLFPCTTCSRLMIQSGIKRVLAPGNPANDRWDEQAKHALTMLSEAGVNVIYY